MNKDDIYKEMGHFNSDNEHKPDIPPNPDATRPRQLNPAVPAHGGNGEGRQNIGHGSDVDSDSDGSFHHGGRVNGMNHDDRVSEDGHDSVDGDEGLEGHKIRVGVHGRIGLRTIFDALARHEDCDCHSGVVPDEWPFPNVNSPAFSGMESPDSMCAEHGSAEDSLASSVIFGLARNPSPTDMLRFVGEYFSDVVLTTMPISHFTATPLALTPELILARGTERPVHYPVDLGLSEDDHSEYDMW